jgi:hypothetical protein
MTMLNGHTELQMIAPSASPAEAAAIVAAIERFRRETMPPALSPGIQEDGWFQAGILEGVRREDLSSRAWGDPSLLD